MIKILLLNLFFIPILFFGQAPEGINYQALIRDASGVVVANQNVGIQLSLLQGNASGGSVYKETFSPTTNDFGLVNLQIGAGTSTLGTFSSIDWSNGTYFIETAVDVNGGTNYVVISTTQFMSVPYALYAKNAELDSVGVQGMIDASPDLDADTTNELQTLSYINDTLSISGGNSVILGLDSLYVKNLIDSAIANSLSFSSAIGSGSSLIFPDGLNNFSSITMSLGADYVVPTGKNLYVTNVMTGGSNNDSVFINNNPIYTGRTYGSYAAPFYGDIGQIMDNPLILGPGDLIQRKPANGNSFSGFLIDAVVDPITIALNAAPNSSPSYTVPTGKFFVLLNAYNHGLNIKVNGTTFLGVGYNSYQGSSSAHKLRTLSMPVLFSEGDVLSHDGFPFLNSKATLNGYLVDYDFFSSHNSNSASNFAKSSNFNFIYPDGNSEFTPVSIFAGDTNNTNLGYTESNWTTFESVFNRVFIVPTGKNLYITSLYNEYCNGVSNNTVNIACQGGNLKINSLDMFSGSAYYGNSSLIMFNQPLIIGEGQTLTIVPVTKRSGWPNFTYFPEISTVNGFLVDNTVQPITIQLTQSVTYVVPPNKKLVILNIYGGYNLKVNSKDLFSNTSNFNQYSSPNSYNSIQGHSLIMPLFFNENDIISSSGIMTINGYLMDK